MVEDHKKTRKPAPQPRRWAIQQSLEQTQNAAAHNNFDSVLRTVSGEATRVVKLSTFWYGSPGVEEAVQHFILPASARVTCPVPMKGRI